MSKPKSRHPLAARQAVKADISLGRRVRVRAAVTVTPAGLLAIGGVVAGILWSVPPIVRAARAAGAARLPGA